MTLLRMLRNLSLFSVFLGSYGAFCIIHNSNNHCCFDVQYIHPADAVKLGQAELLVIDEAAAIPLPLVKKLLGPYLVFMASTINGCVFEELLHIHRFAMVHISMQ